MLSAWRLWTGHHSLETKATCLGGEFVGRAGFGAGCPNVICKYIGKYFGTA